MTRCDWAACSQPATAHEDGYLHCADHLTEHRAYRAQRDCTGCFLPFTPSRPNIRQCDHCRRVRLDRRPTAGKRTTGQRAGAGKRRVIDSPANRCRTCGEWRWSQQACGVCQVAA